MVALPASPHPDIRLVVAMTRHGVIGRNGSLPWDLPADRQLFRRLTHGNTVIMGRGTFESLPAALPGRHNIVVSRTRREFSGAVACCCLDEGISLGRQRGRPIFIIGGAELYREALPMAKTLHVSWVDDDFPGDCFFPEINLDAWRASPPRAFPGFHYVVYRHRPPAIP